MRLGINTTMPQYKCAYLISCCWIGSSRAGECNHGKAITQNHLARTLKPFGISPTTMRVNGWLARRMSAEARLRQRCGARLKRAPGNFCARSRAGQDPFPHRILRHGPWIRLNRSPLGRAAGFPACIFAVVVLIGGYLRGVGMSVVIVPALVVVAVVGLRIVIRIWNRRSTR